ncbi:MAG TPA: acyl-CoA synthetase [Bryobacteraceae bacterium]|nr:acyl-CoA synthetase [Bryobacteraceae bacterium]
MSTSPFDTGLDRNAANFAPLTPISFLAWAADVYPERISGIHGERRFTWRETYQRCRRLASALRRLGVERNTTVAVMLANTPEMCEAHFAIPMAGGVINTLNTRLDAAALAFMLRHGEAKVLITDRSFSPVMAEAAAGIQLHIVDVDDPEYEGPGKRLGQWEYEALLASGDPDFAWQAPADEWDAIALSYTSGTTGDPKGVVTHHRGAYLAAVGNALAWDMPSFAVYLWSVPLFHCNGWCHAWAVAAKAGTNVYLRKVEPAAMLELIRLHRVTHFGGAPIVHTMLLNAPDSCYSGIHHAVHGYIAGAAPPLAVIEGMERRGFRITHIYGLTETYGPATICAKHPQWDELPNLERARLNGRQGVRFSTQEGMTVLDPETMQPVPADAETIGEVMYRGNLTMKGYLKNPVATEQAFAGGWFHTGDLGVLHPDGYVKIKDRSKDIIISGGENISSLEVEDAIHRHEKVLACAVVAQPDKKWGESPVAFVELKAAAEATEEELIAHCREQLAHFKCPKRVIFGAVPRTATGKIQKYVLRERVRSTAAIDV